MLKTTTCVCCRTKDTCVVCFPKAHTCVLSKTQTTVVRWTQAHKAAKQKHQPRLGSENKHTATTIKTTTINTAKSETIQYYYSCVLLFFEATTKGWVDHQPRFWSAGPGRILPRRLFRNNACMSKQTQVGCFRTRNIDAFFLTHSHMFLSGNTSYICWKQHTAFSL